jgi:hypothetical protein
MAMLLLLATAASGEFIATTKPGPAFCQRKTIDRVAARWALLLIASSLLESKHEYADCVGAHRGSAYLD